MPPHPLLDLFPPSPIRDRERAPGPAITDALPPRIARPRQEPPAPPVFREVPPVSDQEPLAFREASSRSGDAASSAREVAPPHALFSSVTGTAADLELASVEADARSPVRAAIAVLVLMASLLAGAGAAAWVFRADVSRVLAHWRR
jgi:hypothetical protein